ncbi:nucleoside triphosphate pyrophosphohydrolase [Acidobacteriota bacterium]
MDDAKLAGEKFEQLVKILDTLRSDGGCPWDREQDEKSITNYFLEEVYEAVDALLSEDTSAIAEELGDVLMEVVFLARIYKEKDAFTMSTVVDKINEKMIRRHPHVFGEKKLGNSEEVLNDWLQGKKAEKKRESLFDGIAETAPALHLAYQIGLRASSYGFDWEKPQDALQKVKEEVAELERALESEIEDDIFQELGDVFFAMANVSRLLGRNPEICLRKATEKFTMRFQQVEKKLQENGKKLEDADLEEMDAIWDQIKALARKPKS